MNNRTVLVAASLLLAQGQVQADTEPSAVDQLDLARYAGTWYEIATIPSFFQKSCVATEIRYTLKKPGELAVENRCRKNTFDGDWTGIDGKAWQAKNAAAEGQLKLQFVWPFSSDFWVLWLDDSYQFTVAGTPDRQSIWILSRQRQMDAGQYQRLLDYAAELGFDTSRIRQTRQPAK